MELNNYLGQKHLIGENKPIYNMIKNKYFCSFVLYGNPGIGKTTLANLITTNLKVSSTTVNATSVTSEELKEIVKLSRMSDQFYIIIDEIHRLDTRKQNYLLPHLEKDNLFIIGTTTENPHYALNSALRSRMHLFQLLQVERDEIISGLKQINATLNAEIYDTVYEISTGDVRKALSIFDYIINNDIDITRGEILLQFSSSIIYDKNKDHHHDLISAFQKSIRASDVNASLFYLARLLISGDFIALKRRLLVITYEDIGLGNPALLARVKIAFDAFDVVGMPEGQLILANVVVDLCLSPKSMSTHDAILEAFEDAKKYANEPIPVHLISNQPHKTAYDKEKTKTSINIPYKLKDKKYYKPTDSSSYEIALAKNYYEIERKRR